MEAVAVILGMFGDYRRQALGPAWGLPVLFVFIGEYGQTSCFGSSCKTAKVEYERTG